jgi:outer membrane protein assembly factor BamB
MQSCRAWRAAAFLLIGMLASLGGAGQPLGGTGDWPQFRGRDRDGIAESTPGEMARLVAAAPKVRWRVPLGAGYSGIAISRGAIFTLYARDTFDYAARFDDRDGREVWRQKIGNAYDAEFTLGPRSTPTVELGVVYALGSFGNLVALDASDGATRWAVDLAQLFQVPQPRFGYTSSPLIVDDLLVIQVGGELRRFVAAFDKFSGALIWKICIDDAGYSSPIALARGGEKELVFLTLDEIVAVSLGGTVLWRFSWPGWNNIAMPIPVPPDQLFTSHNEDDGGLLLRLVEEQGEIRPQEVWRNRLFRNHFSSSVLAGGELYGFDNATLRCVDAATGKQRWAFRGLGKGSLIFAAGYLVVLGDLGDLVLVEARPESYQEVARYTLLSGKCWTAPTLADGKLYLRNEVEMISIEPQAAAAPASAAGAIKP